MQCFVGVSLSVCERERVRERERGGEVGDCFIFMSG